MAILKLRDTFGLFQPINDVVRRGRYKLNLDFLPQEIKDLVPYGEKLAWCLIYCRHHTHKQNGDCEYLSVLKLASSKNGTRPDIVTQSHDRSVEQYTVTLVTVPENLDWVIINPFDDADPSDIYFP